MTYLKTTSSSLPDTQSAPDDRHLAIARVGVRQLRYPLQLRMDGPSGPTVGVWDLAVGLPPEKKGTHMSRFVAWLDDLSLEPELDGILLREKFAAMLTLLGAQEGRVDVSFPFFIRKTAPVSGVASLLDYQGGWIAEKIQNQAVVWTRVQVPVKSLCPCSKEISDYGAHNQRSHVTLRVELLKHVPWRELVRFAEDAASSEIWPMLKRLDEKWVTEHAYDNPKFVEDLVRDVALRLNQDPRIGRYSVEVENFESIHNHSAYALIEKMQ